MLKYSFLIAVSAILAGGTAWAKLQVGLDEFENGPRSSRGLSFEDIDGALFDSKDLSVDEIAEIQDQLEVFNSLNVASNQFASTDEPNRTETNYFCIGGKVAILLFGIQGFRCVDSSGNVVVVGFNPDSFGPSGLTGFIAERYVGLNAGISLTAAIMHHTCVIGRCAIEGSWRDRGRGTRYPCGGTVNAAWFGGGLLGAYGDANNDIYLAGLSAGFSGELSLSSIVIQRE